MSEGRTYWLALDAGWFDRALVVELTAEHGPTGGAALLWLTCHAKQQNDGGRVKCGWAPVARGIGGDAGAVEAALRFAAELGLLDDLDVLPDGRRFTCRISGWIADQSRAAATFRQARSRAARQDVTGRDETVTRDQEQEQEQEEGANAPSSDGPSASELREQSPEIVALCQLLADRMLANDAKAKVRPATSAWRGEMRRLLDLDKRPADEVRAVIDWCQADPFWRANILSPAKLREKFPTLLGRMREPAAKPRRTVNTGPAKKSPEEEARIMADFEERMARRDAARAAQTTTAKEGE